MEQINFSINDTFFERKKYLSNVLWNKCTDNIDRDYSERLLLFYKCN